MAATEESHGAPAGEIRRPLQAALYHTLSRSSLTDGDLETLADTILGDKAAREEFARVVAADPKLESALIYAIRDRQPPVVAAVLNLLAACDAGSRAITALVPFTFSLDPRVRALASSIVARRCPSADWLRKALRTTDPRVRSNILEAAPKEMLDVEMLETALTDPHHRVAGTAALRLLEFDESRGRTAMLALAFDSRPMFRAAAAWALGESRRVELAGVVERLLRDDDVRVRWSARRALVRLRQGRVSSPAPQ